MTLSQLSVFIENKSGTLSRTISILSDAGVDIRALSISDTADFGILRVIVSDVDRAVSVLHENNMAVSKTEVIGIKFKDEPGALAEVLKTLAANKVDVEYSYAFITHSRNEACVVVRVEDNANAIRVLKENNFDLVEAIE